jgi:uncharacterized protein (TIGR03083 family)
VQLTPRYGDRPILVIDRPSTGEHPVLRQRRRLEGILAELSEEEWQHPSRCAGWTVQDVISHLASTNRFWALSIDAGLSEQPTQFLATFDPVASPAQMVEQTQGTPVAETLALFSSGVDAMERALAGLDDDGWATLAEAPPGHVPIALVADHALWDSWVHERDVLLPLGRPATVEADEVLHCLRYGAGLGRAFALSVGDRTTGAMAVEVTDPDERLTVAVEGDVVRIHGDPPPPDAPQLRGDAVTVVEVLSMRAVDGPVPDGVGWLTAGLAEVFEQPPAG